MGLFFKVSIMANLLIKIPTIKSIDLLNDINYHLHIRYLLIDKGVHDENQELHSICSKI